MKNIKNIIRTLNYVNFLCLALFLFGVFYAESFAHNFHRLLDILVDKPDKNLSEIETKSKVRHVE